MNGLEMARVGATMRLLDKMTVSPMPQWKHLAVHLGLQLDNAIKPGGIAQLSTLQTQAQTAKIGEIGDALKRQIDRMKNPLEQIRLPALHTTMQATSLSTIFERHKVPSFASQLMVTVKKEQFAGIRIPAMGINRPGASWARHLAGLRIPALHTGIPATGWANQMVGLKLPTLHMGRIDTNWTRQIARLTLPNQAMLLKNAASTVPKSDLLLNNKSDLLRLIQHDMANPLATGHEVQGIRLDDPSHSNLNHIETKQPLELNIEDAGTNVDHQPGRWILNTLETFCSEQTLNEIYLPAINDMRFEYDQALSNNMPVKGRLILARDHLNLAHAILMFIVSGAPITLG